VSESVREGAGETKRKREVHTSTSSYKMNTVNDWVSVCY
jgi:hypothetical protein